MAKRSAATSHGLTFTFWFSLFLLVLTAVGFSLRAALDTENLPPMRWALGIHAGSCGLWLVYVPLQSWLVTKRKMAVHLALGWASVGLAITIVFSGAVMSFEFLERTRAFAFFFSGMTNFVLFAAFYALALLRRRDRLFHKGMMTYASLALVPPALNRFVFAFDLDRGVTGVGWLVLLLVPWIHDWVRDRRPSSASKLGLALSLATIVVSVAGVRLAGSRRAESVGGDLLWPTPRERNISQPPNLWTKT